MNLNLGVIDEYVTFTEDDWMDTLHSVAAREGLNFGRSAAGALACADRLAKSGHEGSILIIAYDTSDKAREGR
jgi:cysteine synthase